MEYKEPNPIDVLTGELRKYQNQVEELSEKVKKLETVEFEYERLLSVAEQYVTSPRGRATFGILENAVNYHKELTKEPKESN